MRIPPRPARVALLPFSIAVLTVFFVLLLVALVIGLIAAPFGSRRRPLRIAAFGLSYCLMELVVLLRGSWIWLRFARAQASWDRANDRLLVWALGSVLGSARRCLGFTVKVEGPGSALALTGDDPVLVLARHAGPGDSFSLAYLLQAVYGKRTRIVAKDVLQLDPAIDLLLNRRGSCFLGPSSRSGDDNAERVAACAASLEPGDALLLFPEGQNWTPRRRAIAIRRLRDRRRHRAARAAQLMDNVLPPRPVGVAACLRGHRDVDVVVAAHGGLDRLVSAGDIWRAIPFSVPMMVRFWPAQALPGAASEDQVAEWLTHEWSIVDQWVDRLRESGQVEVAIRPR